MFWAVCLQSVRYYIQLYNVQYFRFEIFKKKNVYTLSDQVRSFIEVNIWKILWHFFVWACSFLLSFAYRRVYSSLLLLYSFPKSSNKPSLWSSLVHWDTWKGLLNELMTFRQTAHIGHIARIIRGVIEKDSGFSQLLSKRPNQDIWCGYQNRKMVDYRSVELLMKYNSVVLIEFWRLNRSQYWKGPWSMEY